MTLIKTANQIQSAIDNCFVGCTESIPDKAKAINATLDLFQGWRERNASDYRDALEAGDLSPAEFDATRNCRNQVA